MKEKKLPWYVRYHNLMMKLKMPRGIKKVFVIPIAVGILVFMITHIYSSSKPVPIYEEVHNKDVYNYINIKLEELSDIIIDEGIEINLDKVPEIISEYEIQYTEDGILFNYSLDNVKVISEYYSKTGIMPDDAFNNREMKKIFK